MKILCEQCGKWKYIDKFWRNCDTVYNCLKCFNKNLHKLDKKYETEMIEKLKKEGRIK